MRWQSAVIGVLALAAAAMAWWVPSLRAVAFMVGMAGMFVAASAFSIAGKTAHSLQSFRAARVRVLVHGQPLLESDNTFYVKSVMGIGVGLQIRLQTSAEEPGTLLKIAQPTDVVVSSERLVVGRAAYVQWSRRRIARSARDVPPAVVMERV